MIRNHTLIISMINPEKSSSMLYGGQSFGISSSEVDDRLIVFLKTLNYNKLELLIMWGF